MDTTMFVRRVAAVALAAVGLGCTGGGDSAPPLATGASAVEVDQGWVPINYRGRSLFAQKRGADLVIEGDILVGPADLQASGGDSSDADGTELRTGALSREPGTSFKWPSGNVKYSLTNVTATDRSLVRGGLALYLVPGIQFTELAGACSGDCLNFTTTPASNQHNDSFVGRQGGAQTVNLQISPPPAVVAHEVAHALGAWHEQSRGDRDAFVRINWANVRGCLNSATSAASCGSGPCQAGSGTAAQNAVANGCCTASEFSAGQCYMASNFDKANPQAEMYDYDYDSVMHYGSTAFSKNGLTTITPLQTIPPGQSMGQRSRLSVKDLLAINALYPVLTTTSVLFRDTGVQPVARLKGREEDIDERFSCTAAGRTLGTMLVAATIDTSLIAEGTSTTTCAAQSVLWSKNYRYPNSTDTSWAFGAAIETFSASGPLEVLSPGLIPYLTTPPI